MELLAPAGSVLSAIAAVNNGADAIYLGGKRFHARHAEANITADDLKKVLQYAHDRNCKVYNTLNILVDNDELPEALDDAFELASWGVDGFIVQDLGLMTALRKVLPEIRVHASTQATIHNLDGLQYMKKLGIKRTVLSRELSLKEIVQLHQELPEMELETFVHGALCYSYSGQCLFSSFAGGRSGNRGQCAQPCRKAYKLLSETNPEYSTTIPHYLLSTADQSLLRSLPDLEEAGVTSLKVEGRLKSPEYVAMVTRCYRKVLDILPERCSERELNFLENDMRKVFNRDFTEDYLLGKKRVLRIDRPNNRGLEIGRVTRRQNGYVSILLTGTVKQNDSISILTKNGEVTFTFRQMLVNNRQVNIAGHGDVVTVHLRERISIGDPVYKVRDAKMMQELQASIKEQPLQNDHKIPIYMQAIFTPGQTLVLHGGLIDERISASVKSENLVEKALNKPLKREDIVEKLAKLGNTPFTLEEYEIELGKNITFPFSELNEMRRRLTALLADQLQNQQQAKHTQIPQELYLQNKQAFMDKLDADDSNAAGETPLLTIHVGSLAAAKAAIIGCADRIILDLDPFVPETLTLEDLQAFMKEAEELDPCCEIVLALPKIRRQTKQDRRLELFAEAFPHTKFMLRTLGDLEWAKKHKLSFITDYGFNVYNAATLNQLVRVGADTVALSVELTEDQLQSFNDLAKAEMIVHGHILLMTAEGCSLNHAFLSDGSARCPRFCRQGPYQLIDEKGYAFPLRHDFYCRQYVFNSRELCQLEDLKELLRMHPKSIRIEAQLYNDAEINSLLDVYRKVLANSKTNAEELNKLKKKITFSADAAFTHGHLFQRV